MVDRGFNGAFTLPTTDEYPGDYINITFANETTIPFENIAAIEAKNWGPSIVDGKSFFKGFCVFDEDESSSNTTSTATPTLSMTPATGTTAPTLLGYPYKLVVKDPSNQIAGYFMNGTYGDTAVLRIVVF
jgi:hypothetical protein